MRWRRPASSWTLASALVLVASWTGALSALGAGIDLKRPPRDGLSITAISGGEPIEWAGARLAGGDVNGDGIADLVIGAPGGSDDRPSRRGRLYVVLGSVALPPSLDLKPRRGRAAAPGAPTTIVSDAGVIINGADDFDHLGRSLAVADIDADGFADILVGAPRADGPADSRSDCGEIWVIHGAASLPHIIDLAAPPAGVRALRLIGRASGDLLGASLAVGDLDADGQLDLIAGAPLAGASSGPLAALDTGEVAVIPTARSLPPALDLARPGGTAVWILRGGEAGDQAGSSLAIGDFDGDGAQDLAVGARGADGPEDRRPDAGEVFLMFGPGAGWGGRLESTAGAIITGADIGDLAGGSLVMADLNGDGRAELAIGAELADGRRNARLDAGDVVLMAGRTRHALESLRPAPPQRDRTRFPAVPAPAATGAVALDLATAIPDTAVLHGSDPGDHTGVRTATDLDLDGAMELLVGAEDSSSRRNSRAGGGELMVLAGGKLPAGPLEVALASGLTLFGPSGNAHLGAAAIGLDMNGDALPELIVAGPQSGQSLSGKVWALSADWKSLMRPGPER